MADDLKDAPQVAEHHYTYRGTRPTRAQALPPYAREPYLPEPPLVEAVNLAIRLQRPLLLKGEPGCGKTRLAGAVAAELGLPYEAWYVKSTSHARDGLYTYENLKRLRDAQLAMAGRLSAAEMARLDDPGAYVTWQHLGRTFRNDQRTVVLIDEIDKADIDFPNDLLLELDENRFLVEETGEEVQAKAPPIVFITSNDEKDLPDAFLRRCLFYYIPFPDQKNLLAIVRAHFGDLSLEAAGIMVDRFLALRTQMAEDKGDTGKKVSTSELLDWVRALHGHSPDALRKEMERGLPCPSVLLKSREDFLRYATPSMTAPGAGGG